MASTADFKREVNNLISSLMHTLGGEHNLQDGRWKAICSLTTPHGHGRSFTTTLFARPAGSTKAKITMPLINKLGELKEKGPGHETAYHNVEYQFVVQEHGDDESPSPPGSSGSSS
jgi:hypothetical protein